ncbi:hypothetical protein EYF80_031375 [Liparis tanakae]|uniref:Secretory calcium-binding phosphoprotein 5 n=1 Tax=Liparis tanakae TaxID=230148 RepID=A0A4Z2H0R5_9TELE|nr:hypothetical protein EYF80_031375 [Liparis tanakae]
MCRHMILAPDWLIRGLCHFRLPNQAAMVMMVMMRKRRRRRRRIKVGVHRVGVGAAGELAAYKRQSHPGEDTITCLFFIDTTTHQHHRPPTSPTSPTSDCRRTLTTFTMKLLVLCLCLATSACAAPSIFHYLPHYAGSRQQVPPSQVRNPFTAGQALPQAGVPAGAYSVELIYPHQVAGGAAGSNAAQSFGFIKYSIPQPPGRQSVEVIPSFNPNALPSQDPMQPLQQDQPLQSSQTPAQV